MFRTIKSATKSAGKGLKEGIKSDPEVRKIINRYPRFFKFLKKRLTPDEQFGLYLTVGVILATIFTYLFFKILENFLNQDLLIIADIRIMNIVKTFRNAALNREMLFITYLGKAQIIIVGSCAVVFFMAYLRRWRYLITFIVSVTFGEIIPAVIKRLVDRARPPRSVALINEGGFSFPSGHAFIAMAFYGIIAYFFWRSFSKKENRKRAFPRNFLRIAIVLFFALLIGLIGFSRIYLGVHWPSDVLAAFAAGAAWVTLLITNLEIRRKFRVLKKKRTIIPEDGNTNYLKKNQVWFLGLGLFLVWFLFALYFYKTHPIESVEIKQNSVDQTVNLSPEDIPGELFTSLPKVSESLGGKEMEPINIIVVGNYEQLAKVFQGAGWLKCDRINTQSTWKMITATLANRPYPQAPGVPSLWDAKPNDFAFEKPTSTVKEREHIHFWNTPFLLDGKTNVWFATAHFDQTVKMSSSLLFPTHSIDPAIDKERNKIKDELVATGLMENVAEFQIVEPTMGKNQVGDTFFTDGKAYVFYLKGSN